MTRRSFLIAGAVVLALVLGDRPQLAALQAPQTQPSITELNVNGLKVLVKRRVGSLTVAGGLFIRGGAQNVTADDAGAESLMLDVATEASTAYPRERFRRELSRTGTVIGSGVNEDYSAFTISCTRQHFDSAWGLFTDAALHPSFAADDFERVKNRYLVGLAGDEDTPDSYLQTLEARVIYAGHPYANDPHGTLDSVKKLTVADMMKIHKQLMQTSRMLLVLVGDLDAQDVKSKVEAAFKSTDRGAYAPTAVRPLSFPAPTVSVTAKELPTNYVQGTYAAPSPSSPDIYPMRIATSILRDRIFEEVRLKRALSYAPDASLGSQAANTGGIYVTAVDANQAVKVMLDEITKLRTTDVSAQDIQSTSQQFLTNYYVGQETNAAQAGTLAQAEIVGGGWKTAGEFLDRLRAVTPEEVRRVANTYLRNLQFVVLGNPQSVDKQVFLQQIGGAAFFPGS